MKFTIITAVAALMVGTSQACYMVAHSSTAGSWDFQHSEPKDHGGAPQTVSSSYGSCSFSGNMNDGCTVSVHSSSGCGTLSFSIAHSG